MEGPGSDNGVMSPGICFEKLHHALGHPDCQFHAAKPIGKCDPCLKRSVQTLWAGKTEGFLRFSRLWTLLVDKNHRSFRIVQQYFGLPYVLMTICFLQRSCRCQQQFVPAMLEPKYRPATRKGEPWFHSQSTFGFWKKI